MNKDDRVIIDLFEKRLHNVEDHQITLNHEMGQIIGEMRWIKLLLCASTLGIMGQLLYNIFGG